MRKWLLITTAIVSISAAKPADAAPIVVAAAGAVTTWWGGLSVFSQALIRVGAGLVLSAVTRPKVPSPAGLKRELPNRTSLPAKRFVYGHYKMTGTPLVWYVDGRNLYGCILYNSRPSAGTNLSITLDGRRCSIHSGDIYDFTGAGAKIEIEENFPEWDAGADQFHCWLGLGDQTTCPDRIVSETGGKFLATDAARGLTVLWVRFQAGSAKVRAERWPNPEPIVELKMDWSKVWQPLVRGQDQDDPATWGFSAIQATCLLDACRFNPIRSYNGRLDMAGFIRGAQLANERVTLWHASQAAGETVTQKRYTVGTVIDWTAGELLDLITPLAQAGAGELAQVGGELHYIPGEYRTPSYTITDILDDGGVTFVPFTRHRDMHHAVRGSWIAAEREFEAATLEAVPIVGGSTDVDDIFDLNLTAVTDGYQAQRVVQIEANRRASQSTLDCVLTPSAIEMTVGDNATANVPAPFQRYNGIWQLRRASPGVWLQDEEGGKVAFRVPASLKSEAASIYAWNPETQEVEIEGYELPAIPGAATVIDDLALEIESRNTGGASLPFIIAKFSPVSGADRYLVQTRYAATQQWQEIILDDATEPDNDGKLSVVFGPAAFGETYSVEARVETATKVSDPAVANIMVTLATDTTGGGPVGSGSLNVQGTAPDAGYFLGLALYRGAVSDDFEDAEQVGGAVVPPGEPYSVTFNGIPTGTADFWLVPVSVSGPTGVPEFLGTQTIT